jgi:hypothetical protein
VRVKSVIFIAFSPFTLYLEATNPVHPSWTFYYSRTAVQQSAIPEVFRSYRVLVVSKKMFRQLENAGLGGSSG